MEDQFRILGQHISGTEPIEITYLPEDWTEDQAVVAVSDFQKSYGDDYLIYAEKVDMEGVSVVN